MSTATTPAAALAPAVRAKLAELGVRYLVEGTVRKSGPRLRISVQLVDPPAGACLWADQYEFADADLFDVQDAIVQQVAGAIEPALLRNVAAAARRRGGGLTAWNLVAQGTWLFHHVTRPTHQKARELLQMDFVAPKEALLASADWLVRHQQV